jgi:NADH:ubiquinone oxidoreductase subunit 2 (subunit N)
VISVYYYLRLTVAMYVDEELVEREKPTLSPGLIIATLACAVGILYVGLNAGNIQQLFAIPVGG